jgi:hypothetical protein
VARGLQRYKMPVLRQNVQCPDWHAAGPASQAGPLAEICRRPERLGERPCGSGAGRRKCEHLVPPAASLLECRERRSGSAAYRHRRGR